MTGLYRRPPTSLLLSPSPRSRTPPRCPIRDGPIPAPSGRSALAEVARRALPVGDGARVIRRTPVHRARCREFRVGPVQRHTPALIVHLRDYDRFTAHRALGVWRWRLDRPQPLPDRLQTHRRDRTRPHLGPRRAAVRRYSAPPTRYGRAVRVHHRCRSDLLYCDAHDADFCPVCDEWISARCGDPECGYCPMRAERPSLCTHGDDRHWNMNE